ncbi:hypothetical protein PHLCEN_2v7363 [Hermanssonia centrifuga]|uniref:Uncharacterized protein n=1 Tax=Hermanssonia centrifuga TaxID=98765 RepID=A0A2R6NWU5_9APHY|nr:hypothetical protein PHLCEN_2v7363 [Hermanssonia centrifuga]
MQTDEPAAAAEQQGGIVLDAAPAETLSYESLRQIGPPSCRSATGHSQCFYARHA